MSINIIIVVVRDKLLFKEVLMGIIDVFCDITSSVVDHIEGIQLLITHIIPYLISYYQIRIIQSLLGKFNFYSSQDSGG